jgi:hypothetical protein
LEYLKKMGDFPLFVSKILSLKIFFFIPKIFFEEKYNFYKKVVLKENHMIFLEFLRAFT